MSALSPRNVQPRQSLLFSATIPDGIRETADLDRNCAFINTLKPGEENTHEHVPQEYVVVPNTDLFAATVALLKQSFEQDPHTSKVMLFFPTARLTGLFASLLEELKKNAQGSGPLGSVPLYEVHSRKSQPARAKAAKEFSQSARGILCSSDVTARGVDFPGVSQVIQVSLPANSDQYIHRLGRTARESVLCFARSDSCLTISSSPIAATGAGASGSGILILNQAETFFLRTKAMRALSITQMATLPDLSLTKPAVLQALAQVSDKEKAQAYSACEW